jgi:hypothetical protein
MLWSVIRYKHLGSVSTCVVRYSWLWIGWVVYEFVDHPVTVMVREGVGKAAGNVFRAARVVHLLTLCAHRGVWITGNAVAAAWTSVAWQDTCCTKLAYLKLMKSLLVFLRTLHLLWCLWCVMGSDLLLFSLLLSVFNNNNNNNNNNVSIVHVRAVSEECCSKTFSFRSDIL